MITCPKTTNLLIAKTGLPALDLEQLAKLNLVEKSVLPVAVLSGLRK